MPVASIPRPQVLVVDDDPISRSIVSRRLAALADIVEASDGYRAIAHLKSKEVHLVVVDLDMPGINGLDVIRFMRANHVLRAIPIIVLSANEIDGLQQSLMAGVTSALKKPLDWRAFGEHVRHLLELAFRAGHLAYRDTLTGLANRILFEDRLRQALAGADKASPLALHLLDLDHFKQVNDSLGHAAGDELLVEVARSLGSVAFEAICTARLGGDEFAILQPLPAMDAAEAAAALARSIIQSIARDYVLSPGVVRIGASVGIDIASSPTTEVGKLMRNADRALYAAKHAGRCRFRLHVDERAEPAGLASR